MQSVQDGAKELRQQLGALDFPPSPARKRKVRRHVCDFVDQQKALGWPPERVIVALKQIAQEAGFRSSDRVALVDAQIAARDEFLAEMVSWCIERYYDASLAR